jgi:hypothetical protein
MPISFLNDPNLSDLISSRPVGYKFPVGLSVLSVANTSVDYLMVAGGGGGGWNLGGGGGAGGLLTGTTSSLSSGSNSYSITVGGGGSGRSSQGGKGGNGSSINIYRTYNLCRWRGRR